MGVNNSELIKEELIFLDYEASDKKDLITKMGIYAQSKGYVKESFLEAILKREDLYPTGLRGENLAIAIPHTDAIHINEPAVFFTRLKNTVKFKEMGIGVDDIDVQLVFMLLIKTPEDQVDMLSNLMGLFAKPDMAEILKNSTDKEEIYNTLVSIVSNN